MTDRFDTCAKGIVISSMSAIDGPNVYSHRPVLVSVVELGRYAGHETREWPHLTPQLLALLPGLRSHHCSEGRSGGLLDRLDDGIYFGHLVEHVALELADSAGIGGTHGRTRAIDEPHRYRLVVEHRCAPAMRLLMQHAVSMVEALAEHLPVDDTAVARMVADARSLALEHDLGPSTGAVLAAARERGIPVIDLGGGRVWQLGTGVHRRLVSATLTSRSSAIAVDIVGDKQWARSLLGSVGLPVPAGDVVRTGEEALQVMTAIAAPVAVKPLDANQGKGVTLGIRDARTLLGAVDRALDFSDAVVVERFIDGDDYRLLVIDGRMVAASRRVPAHVVGDGVRTVRELVEAVNADPRRGPGHTMELTWVRVDAAAARLLASQGHGPNSVPRAGERVALSHTANLSTGGTAVDVTDLVDPSVRAMAERAARWVGLDVCGVDVVARAIDRPLAESGATIIELNAAPGIRMHHHPVDGEPRDVGSHIVESLFPADAPLAVPLVAVTGTNGKTTTTRLISHLLHGRHVVGTTTTSGVDIADTRVVTGDCTGPISARTVLTDPSVEVAVLETARGGIVRSGLGWEWCDVAVVTNVSADHLGQDGIDTVADLADVKALVPERVRRGGVVVLNADDPFSLGMRDRPAVRRQQPRVVMCTLADPLPPAVHIHVREGGVAVSVADGWITEHCDERSTPLFPVRDLRLSWGGLLRHHVANAMMALAAARAVDPAVDPARLADFECHQNPARGEFHRVRDALVLLDYGHNPGAIAAVSEAVRHVPATQRRCVLGVPGDRSDDLVRASARAASGFDVVYVREDRDRRGRAPGETAALMTTELARTATPASFEGDEEQAMVRALGELRDGELLVVFVDDPSAAPRVVREAGGRPVEFGAGARWGTSVALAPH